MTAERFVSVQAVGGARLYRTGDLAVRRPNGTIECLGRVDNQVKVRGFRVELEAVEAAVMRHPKVAAAAARVWPESDGGMRLSVYVTGRNAAPPDAATLRQFLQGFLPEFMIPSDVLALATIPLTSNGKINRAALQPPSQQERSAPASLAAAASTKFEQRLAVIWSGLLGIDLVDMQANFFDLGGHSLLVAALQQRIAKAFGQRVTMAALFHAPTVRQQAALIETLVMGGASLPEGVLPLQPLGLRVPIFWLHPLTPIRTLTDALGEDQPVYGVLPTQDHLNALGATPGLELIAARHAKAIVKAYPQGPYVLAGLCTGGIVAYEVAAQLRNLGRDVALVVLLDSQNPVYYKRVDNLDVELSKIRFHLTKAWQNGGRAGSVPLMRRLMARIRPLAELRPRAVTEMGSIERLTDQAAFRYRPEATEEKVLLLQPQDRPSEVNYLPGWVTVAPGLISMDVDGHHDELLQSENVQSVADAILFHVSNVIPKQMEQKL